MFEPWMLAAIDEAGYNGISEDHIRRVAQRLLQFGEREIDRSLFERACRDCGIAPSNFTQYDLDRLEDYLNR